MKKSALKCPIPACDGTLDNGRVYRVLYSSPISDGWRACPAKCKKCKMWMPIAIMPGYISTELADQAFKTRQQAERAIVKHSKIWLKGKSNDKAGKG